MTTTSAELSIRSELNIKPKHLGDLDPLQIQIWRRMTPAQRLDIAFRAYQFALDAVRLTERQRHPDLSESELNWRVTRRMQGDQSLGILDSLHRCYLFNVIQPATGAKIDLVPLPSDPFTRAAFKRPSDHYLEFK